jgi:hypothetical protein
MEDAMLNIRIITAGAMMVMMTGVAAAQSDASAPAGKPISLLQGLLHPAKQKLKAHTKSAHRQTTTFSRRASRKSHLLAQSDDPASAASASPVAAQTTPAAEAAPTAETMAASAWPADTATSLPAASPLADAASPGQPAPAQSSSSAMPVDGSAVQVSSPDEINAIDLAADASHPAAPAVVALAQQDDGQSNRDAWYEELLATLGGAFAAASVAWFLIGSVPPVQTERDDMPDERDEPSSGWTPAQGFSSYATQNRFNAEPA